MTETDMPTTETVGTGLPTAPPDVRTEGGRAAPRAEASVERSPEEIQAEVRVLGDALLELATRSPELASTLARMTTVVVTEASRSARLARALAAAARPAKNTPGRAPAEMRQHRRASGPIDPFAVFAEVGEDGLRERLGSLSVDQLRDIIAEHRMDQDRLAMKWKDTARLTERIVERVKTRSVKGDVFRSR